VEPKCEALGAVGAIRYTERAINFMAQHTAWHLCSEVGSEVKT
jgi:hypothetical protein